MKKNSKILVLILVLVSFLTIGYAILSTNIKLNGKSILGKTTFDIYFDNVKILKGEELTGTPPTTTGRSTKELSYEINFSKPRDTYQFNVDIVNGGTLDAMVNLVSSNSLGSEFDQFGEYSLTYADGSTIEGKNYLRSSSKETITVTIRFKDEMSALLAENKQVQFNLTLEYVYADETHDNRENSNLTVKDLSNNGNNGVVHGAVFNKDGTITLDGEDDFIDCGLDHYNFGNTATFVLRFKFLKLKNHQNFFGNGGAFIMGTQDQKIGLGILLNDTWHQFMSNQTINENDWITLVATYNGSQVNLYSNGTLINDSTNSFTDNIPINYLPIVIGGSPIKEGTDTKVSTASNIMVSSTAIFDRAMTSEEIIRDYSSEINVTDTTDLLLHYEFD